MSARISHMLHLVGLAGQERKKVKSFSFGMKQRLGLAQALMGPGSFLMLDEPFVGLDPPGKELFKDALVREAKVNDKAVLFSSHDLADVADVCDRIVLVREGEVVYSGAYDRRRRLTVRTSAPALIPDGIAGVEVRGNTLLMSDAAQMNELIDAGVFEQCRIVDIAAPDDALMALFDE